LKTGLELVERTLALVGIMTFAGAGAVLLMVLPFRWGLIGVWAGVATLMALRALTLAARYYPTGRFFHKKLLAS
jgi:MATE family multidrug resistance protein